MMANSQCCDIHQVESEWMPGSGLKQTAEVLRERFPDLTVVGFENQQQPFLHIWRTVTKEDDASYGLAFLPTFNVIVTCSMGGDVRQDKPAYTNRPSLEVLCVPSATS